jgi:CRISPR-associated protein Csb3
MNSPEATITIALDPANPGQFFACCGVMELADRLWRGAHGWFCEDATTFHVAPLASVPDATASRFIAALAGCEVTNTMKPQQVARFRQLCQMTGKERAKTPGLDDEKDRLEKLWREEPIVLHAPFDLRIDWFLDDRAGGSRYKTWAGRQCVIDIALAMMRPIAGGGWNEVPPRNWLNPLGGDGLPFNFDSNLGRSSSIDVGFSLDPLSLSPKTRPFIEIGAFVGLQRFRPASDGRENRHVYTAWTTPLLPAAAAGAAAGRREDTSWPAFEFQLLYRTKYLKSFLPATPIRGAQ